MNLVIINLALVGVVMLFAEYYQSKKSHTTKFNNIKFSQAVAVGLAQALALIPGVSRSGSTITAGLFAGLDRFSATKFSFMLAMPITFGAILKVLLSADSINQIGSSVDLFVVGVLTSFISGWLAIKFLLKFVANHSLALFAYYRIGIAIVLIAYL